MKINQNQNNLINSFDFIISATSDFCISGDLDSTILWVNQIKSKIDTCIKKVDLYPLDNWNFDNEESIIRHSSGGFYSIEGIRIESNIKPIQDWDQPIINQNEIGYLGFLVKKFNGVLHFLVQAKIEPGNINIVQISPTLQATKSNALSLHKGESPPYLSYFINPNNQDIIIDNLHSELGSKFLKKRNRNLIVSTSEDIEIIENFKWITLKQLKKLALFDNMLNIDSRSLLATVIFPPTQHDKLIKQKYKEKNFLNINSGFLKSFINEENDFNDLNLIINRISKIKFSTNILIKKIKLKEMRSWEIRKELIRHKNDSYFKVIGVDSSISNREKMSWQQPMIEGYDNGIYGCFIKNINGKFHILTQIKAECANKDLVELAPTLQINSLDDNHKNKFDQLIIDFINQANKNKFIFDTIQSEEGGRFFQIQNRHLLLEISNNDLISLGKIPDNYLWISLNQLTKLNRFDNILNIQLRSIIAMIPFL